MHQLAAEEKGLSEDQTAGGRKTRRGKGTGDGRVRGPLARLRGLGRRGGGVTVQER